MAYGKGANVAEPFCDAAKFKENTENLAIIVLLNFLCISQHHRKSMRARTLTFTHEGLGNDDFSFIFRTSNKRHAKHNFYPIFIQMHKARPNILRYPESLVST